MNETITLALIVAAPSIIIALISNSGNKARYKLEEKEARAKQQTAETELDLKLQETTDRIRRELWADVETKMDRQGKEIDALKIITKSQTEQIQRQAIQIKEMQIEIDKKDETITRNGIVIEKKDTLIKEQEARIRKLINGGII